jgi:hypothetical protein
VVLKDTYTQLVVRDALLSVWSVARRSLLLPTVLYSIVRVTDVQICPIAVVRVGSNASRPRAPANPCLLRRVFLVPSFALVRLIR